MRAFTSPLPIDDALPALEAALREGNRAVLVAPPGAGKTTRVPLVLLDAPWRREGRILVLEPRRLAARGAAARMAETLGEGVGDTIGLRARLDTRVSARTRIEVVTEGVFTRMILADPTLEGVAGVLFDEFHERSLDADMGLAFALEAQSGLRPDLRLLVMSATLDGARVAALLGEAPVIASEGRSFPIETRYLGRKSEKRIEDDVADAVIGALVEPGSILVFLPGQAEIRRVAERLAVRIAAPETRIVPLYGALTPKEQDEAVRPATPGTRKIVLATSIAETSLTIEGVRIVIDSGLARVPRYEPDAGVTRLETVRVSRAAADQRRGRAGRTEPGLCLRLWREAETAGLPAFTRPEILDADLSGLILGAAEWGVTDPNALPFLDPPPAAALKEARAQLSELGALDADGRLTDLGRRFGGLPLPPPLARMVLVATEEGAAGTAAELAALLVERGLGGVSVDLEGRLHAFRRDRSGRAEQMRTLARGWAKASGAGSSAPDHGVGVGALLALAYPQRIAKARGAPGAYVLANGRGATLDAADPLARSPYLVVAELTGSAAASRILAAAALDESDLLSRFAKHVVEALEITFEPQAAALRARRVRRLGAIVLGSEPRPVPQTEAAARALVEGIVGLGIDRLPWTKALRQWRDRIGFLRAAEGPDGPWPDLSDTPLAASAVDWLAPGLVGTSTLAEIGAADLAAALAGLLPWPLAQRLEREAPTHFLAPTGQRHAIDYAGEGAPILAIRVQELFGLDQHPALARGRLPLTLHLLSPAQRPIQITRDLPGFWRGSWSAVKADMRGRYPKHLWPDDPTQAEATTRAKPRGT